MNKNKTVAIALILLLTVSAAIAVSVQFEAQAIDIPTFVFATASPNPVGIGQGVYIGAMFSKPPPTTAGSSGDRYENVTIDIIDPDGVKTVMGPYLTSMAAGVQFTYTPSKVGNYTVQAHYPGEIMDGANPERPTPGGGMPGLRGSKLLPSDSNIITLVVQEDPVEPMYKTPPFPTEFWVRPIYGTNWNWAEVGANWFGLSAGAGFSAGGSGQGGSDYARNFQPNGAAPNAPHIMWTIPTQVGGQPGMPVPGDQSSMYHGTSLLGTYFKPVCIINGILYYHEFTHSGSQFIGWKAVDIHTGETLWKKAAAEVENQYIDWGQVMNYVNFQEFGSISYLYTTVSQGMFRVYDPMTGTYRANVTNTRSTTSAGV